MQSENKTYLVCDKGCMDEPSAYNLAQRDISMPFALLVEHEEQFIERLAKCIKEKTWNCRECMKKRADLFNLVDIVSKKLVMEINNTNIKYLFCKELYDITSSFDFTKCKVKNIAYLCPGGTYTMIGEKKTPNIKYIHIGLKEKNVDLNMKATICKGVSHKQFQTVLNHTYPILEDKTNLFDILTGKISNSDKETNF